MLKRSVFTTAIVFLAVALISVLLADAASVVEQSDPQSLQTNGKQHVTVVGTNEPANIHVVAGVSRQETLSYKGASYIAVKFESFHLPPGDQVIVRSPDNSIAYTYTGKGRADAGSFYATFIPGDTAIAEYYAQGSQIKSNETETKYGYSIPAFARGFQQRSPLSICGYDQSVPAKCYAANTTLGKTLPRAYQRSQAVARLLVRGTGLCTGWLAGSAGHLITNQHCIPSGHEASLVDVEFGAESGSCEDQCRTTRGCAGTVVATRATLVASSADHDYALVRLPPSVNVKAYGYLRIRASGPVVQEPIYIPQHPMGHAKRIAGIVDGGAAATIKSLGRTTKHCGLNRVMYSADTQGGSSGSPVLSAKDNFVVALHNCGGCDNAGVDIRDVVSHLQKKGIVVPNLIAPGTVPITPTPTTAAPTPEPTTPAPTPLPGNCDGLTSATTCEAAFFCAWNTLKRNCQRWWN